MNLTIRKKYMALIILADDDYDVRLSTKLLLESEGYDCLDYPNGDDALDALRANKDARLLVSDVYMPSSDGRDVVDILRNGPPRFRNLPVLQISGIIPEQTMQLHIKDNNCRFLKKPFTGEQLRTCIKKML